MSNPCSIVYPVDYKEGYDWFCGRMSDAPLPIHVRLNFPFVGYIHQVYKADLHSALFLCGLMLKHPNLKAFIWRSTCDIVMRWTRGESTAQSIFDDDYGSRWIAPIYPESRFCRIARKMEKNYRGYGKAK
jgi:hypothetical protein